MIAVDVRSGNGGGDAVVRVSCWWVCCCLCSLLVVVFVVDIGSGVELMLLRLLMLSDSLLLLFS